MKTIEHEFDEWCKARGVWPRLTHEEIWRAAWNAATKAANDKAWKSVICAIHEWQKD